MKVNAHIVCLDFLSFDIFLCSLDGVDSLSLRYNLCDRRGHYKPVRKGEEDKTPLVSSGVYKSLRREEEDKYLCASWLSLCEFLYNEVIWVHLNPSNSIPSVACRKGRDVTMSQLSQWKCFRLNSDCNFCHRFVNFVSSNMVYITVILLKIPLSVQGWKLEDCFLALESPRTPICGDHHQTLEILAGAT